MQREGPCEQGGAAGRRTGLASTSRLDLTAGADPVAKGPKDLRRRMDKGPRGSLGRQAGWWEEHPQLVRGWPESQAAAEGRPCNPTSVQPCSFQVARRFREAKKPVAGHGAAADEGQLPQSPQGRVRVEAAPRRGRGRRGPGPNVLEHEGVYSAPVSSENHKTN